MDSQNGSNMPSLWVFLIIVLAVLLGVVMGTSFVMHMIQRRQRTLLQRRIARGEVDLEVLGIKRLNVPQETIEKMPQYTFKSVPDNVAQPETTATAANNNATSTHNFFQPTCSICLDDFVLNETQVRELPCKHIFHPECIDPFLRENSSLCPLCKRSALPPGYCPIQVTNVMVRRERLARRLRDGHSTWQQQTRQYVPPGAPTIWSRRLDRIRGPSVVAAPPTARLRNAGLVHGVPEVIRDPAPQGNAGITELGPIQSRNPTNQDFAEPPPDIARRGTMARRAWRRERVASMHARQYNEQAEEAQREDARRPLWRRVLGVA